MTKTSQKAAQQCALLEMADELLAERALQEPGAFAGLYDRYLKPVYRYFFLRLGNRPEAEDLTSQVFLAALESLPGYRRGSPFRAWLFGIARRKLADYYRLRRPQVSLEQVGDLSAVHDPPWRAWRAASNCAGWRNCSPACKTLSRNCLACVSPPG